MTVLAESFGDDETCRIRINGRFDFSMNKRFRDVYENVADGTSRYVIDLEDAEYMDSSALGMLLLLRDHAGGDRAAIEIVNCNPEIRKILEIANFHYLFDIK